MATLHTVAPLVVGCSLLGAASPAWASQPETPPAETPPATTETAAPAGDPTADASADTSASFGADAGASADAGGSDAGSDSAFFDSSADTSGSADASADTSGGFEGSGAALGPAGDAEIAASQTGLIDPFKGRLALGAIHTIAGMNGINVRYFITDRFAVGATAGVALFAYKEDDPESDDPCPGDDCTFEENRTVASMGFSLEALYFAKLGREAGTLPFRADFGLGGRFGVLSAVNNTDIGDNLDDPTELHIEIPLIFQLMFGNNFALSPELGMDFRIVPGSREKGDTNPGHPDSRTNLPGGLGDTDGPGFGWDITDGIGLFGGVSLHYFFGGA